MPRASAALCSAIERVDDHVGGVVAHVERLPGQPGVTAGERDRLELQDAGSSKTHPDHDIDQVGLTLAFELLHREHAGKGIPIPKRTSLDLKQIDAGLPFHDARELSKILARLDLLS